MSDSEQATFGNFKRQKQKKQAEQIPSHEAAYNAELVEAHLCHETPTKVSQIQQAVHLDDAMVEACLIWLEGKGRAEQDSQGRYYGSKFRQDKHGVN